MCRGVGVGRIEREPRRTSFSSALLAPVRRRCAEERGEIDRIELCMFVFFFFFLLVFTSICIAFFVFFFNVKMHSSLWEVVKEGESVCVRG